MNSPLTYLIRKPNVSIENPPLLILLHGVGSNENDLFSLTDFLPDSLMVVSVRGPITLGRDRFGWYEITFSGGVPKIDTEQQVKSHKIILEFLEYLSNKYRFNSKQVWIGGFSQGAVMSYSVGLEHPDRIKGIIALSGRLLEETKSQILIEDQSKGQRIYIAHGTNDNVIPVTSARASKDYLESVGLVPIYKEYMEGHTISQEMLKDLVSWLEKELA
ncbi:putative esterase [Leptospira yanagawae serovar Saopaulo str. Sao Paulo = ATCC 700523]|uniref:Putative esterase n=1 Tax=Leptospira yanagawae serovar Saopaulo str. Sao Paulo = ATCC 700523 TaxID=1249483 RepID=A0A5E8HDL3_9LEPT|nr:alpha/beta hydrolase-fold protein [Leptospira yanagawae]EOQ88877.1 putative esterase [Leptospira yanagawae serovar Saopaulo str. Sao Paulo = ATCC 700523]